MITTNTNLDYLIPFLRLRLNNATDLNQYSDSLLRTALVSSINYLAPKWNWKYFVYTPEMNRGTMIETPSGPIEAPPGLAAYDVVRNPSASFKMSPPPVIEQQDEPIIVLAASILIRQALLASSTSVFTNWSTPDFAYSNVASSRAILDVLQSEREELNALLHVYAKPLRRAIR